MKKVLESLEKIRKISRTEENLLPALLEEVKPIQHSARYVMFYVKNLVNTTNS